MPDKLDDTQNLQGTQPVNLPEWNPESHRTPTPISGHVQQPAQRADRRVRKRKNDRSQSPLFLPAWSVGIMLLLVFGIAASIVMLVITLGGQNTPGGEPRIVIITAQPTRPSAAQTAEPTSPGIEPLPSFQGPIPTFALEGPTLAPIILSPTPIQITVSATVIVNVDGLNIREQPGTGSNRVAFANKGDRFTVMDGPQDASNLTWWKIRSEADSNVQGWAAADYLDVAIQ